LNDPLEALAAITTDAWLVGGALRDRLLGRPTNDFDVAVRGGSEPIARTLAEAVGGHAFELSEAFGAWRVISRRGGWQLDVLPLSGESLVDDLAKRDFTINALAEPLLSGRQIDPFGGLAARRARRLRMVSPGAFEQDPRRTLRRARLACQLGFAVEAETEAAASRSAAGLERIAAERVFGELKQIVSAERALQGLELMDATGATAVVLPELTELRGVEQSRYHHLDVDRHTRAVLAETIALERDPEPALGPHARAVGAFLAEPLADGLTRGQALRFGALLHDVAKPRTRAVTSEGRVTFLGHDELGAALADEVLGRLRAGDRLRAYVGALTRHHLRLGFLVHEAPLSRHAIYRYLRACEPVQVDVTVLSVADRLATRGLGSERAIVRHLDLARQLLGDALAWTADPPRPPVRGDELASALGMRRGPELGALLEQLEEEIRAAVPRATVLTHLEPVEEEASFADQGLDRADARPGTQG
jgi:putative nucleotidyltransferase with HDIG domain